VSVAAEPRHLPYPAPVEAYGKGGFRFAGMSHRGSLLCLPDGIWPWPPRDTGDLTDAAFEPVFAHADTVDLLLIGTVRAAWTMPPALRVRFRESKISIEITTTGSAVSTYNILLGEGRRVAAALIADD
jgi:uncharacterized protein